MACQPCTSNSSPASFQFNTTFSPCGCDDGDCGCGGNSLDSKCVFYTGPNLPCGQISTGSSLEDILIKIDQKLCTTIGNYQLYNKACLDDSSSISTEQDFVEAISTYVCQTRTDLTTFTGTTFPNYQTTLNTRFTALEVPGITCAFAGVISSDTLQTTLNKYCTAFNTLNTAISLSGILWDSCLTVDPDPITIAQGFNVLIGQICDIRANTDFSGSGSLPTFNNTGSCLPAPLGAEDSLVLTINKIKTQLCNTGTLDVNALTWGCTAKPSSNTTDLQGALGAILSKLTTLSQNVPTFDSSFTTELTDGGDACSGITVHLAATSILDKYVAVDGSDSSPGTLVNKLQAGSGITLDTSSTPGIMKIISSGSISGGDGKVKTSSADPTSDYLEAKIEGSSGTDGIVISPTTDAGTQKVNIQASVDFTVLWPKLLTYLNSTPTAKSAFCDLVNSCLPDCIVPPNVTVVYSNTDATTTTSTTTTTTTT